MEEYTPKLVALPGVRLSPEFILHRTLGKVGRIRSVVVVIEWDDESMDLDWSVISTSKMCMAAMAVHEQARRIMYEDAGEKISPPPTPDSS